MEQLQTLSHSPEVHICFTVYRKIASTKKEKDTIWLSKQLQKAQISWQKKRQERIDFINRQLLLEKKAEAKFTELDDAMREYHRLFGKKLEPLPPEPILSDFYTPSDEQHFREIAFITLGMTGIGGILYYLEG